MLPPGLPPEPPPIPSVLHCPLLAELHNALDTKIGDILTSAHFDYKLSPKLNEDMEQVTEFFVSVQRQINSLASVALQNRQALDILTTKKGRDLPFPRQGLLLFC